MAKIGGEKGITITVKRSTWKKLSKLNIDRDDDDNLSDTIDYLLNRENTNI